MIYFFFLFPLSSTAVFRHTLHIHTIFSSSHAHTPIYKYFILENNVIPSSSTISPVDVVTYRPADAVTMNKKKMGKPKRFNVLFLTTIIVFEKNYDSFDRNDKLLCTAYVLVPILVLKSVREYEYCFFVQYLFCILFGYRFGRTHRRAKYVYA